MAGQSSKTPPTCEGPFEVYLVYVGLKDDKAEPYYHTLLVDYDTVRELEDVEHGLPLMENCGYVPIFCRALSIEELLGDERFEEPFKEISRDEAEEILGSIGHTL